LELLILAAPEALARLVLTLSEAMAAMAVGDVAAGAAAELMEPVLQAAQAAAVDLVI
jgi:hypothetical protein